VEKEECEMEGSFPFGAPLLTRLLRTPSWSRLLERRGAAKWLSMSGASVSARDMRNAVSAEL
jgi:hypothetical protein